MSQKEEASTEIPPETTFVSEDEQEGSGTSSTTAIRTANPRPYDNKIFIYMFINHINDINTIEQTFYAKFYFRATWVQKKSSTDLTQLSIESCSSWPSDIYQPNFSFSNAVDHIDLHNPSLHISRWREPADMVSDPDQYSVLEWKVYGSGTFTSFFDMTNYPMDIQQLKITMESLDVKTSLHDDFSREDKNMSVVRKDTFTSNTFELYEDPTTSTKGSDQLMLIPSNEDVLLSLSDRKFTFLSFIVPVRRYTNHHIYNMCKICLIATSSFASFLFPPHAISNRLAVSITIGLVMAADYGANSQTLPNMEQTNDYTKYIFHSFFMVFLMVIIASILASVACKGNYCDDDSNDDDVNNNYDNGEEDKFMATDGFLVTPIAIADFVICVVFFLYWVVINGRLFYDLWFKYPSNAKKGLVKVQTEDNASICTFKKIPGK